MRVTVTDMHYLCELIFLFTHCTFFVLKLENPDDHLSIRTCL